MRMALLPLLLLAACAGAAPPAPCVPAAPDTRALARLDALVADSERALARGYRAAPGAVGYAVDRREEALRLAEARALREEERRRLAARAGACR